MALAINDLTVRAEFDHYGEEIGLLDREREVVTLVVMNGRKEPVGRSRSPGPVCTLMQISWRRY